MPDAGVIASIAECGFSMLHACRRASHYCRPETGDVDVGVLLRQTLSI